ncbi:MAG TPA: glycoside hydrolase family 2 TIM barrel-domain containing protein [Microbacteriaceae bacterium]|jgi:beta-galactosidase/beta-glucuronidase|nr:glycoside hydrolase family 2 TIM barrel-domain containing protein [Microbacteriaceae bacterium]
MTSTIDAASTHASNGSLPIASRQDGTYPRPQLLRANWANLNGPWLFRHDDDDVGASDRWYTGLSDASQIVVPFPPESQASGIAAPGFHPVVWYERTITSDEIIAAGATEASPRVLLHFGAVDYRARVWIDGAFVGEHEGGHTPFTFDVTAAVRDGNDHRLVVRVEDDPHDLTQPRGKQDWHEHPHAIWYQRTTGIWQTVWLEAVPETAIEHLIWSQQHATALDVTIRFLGRIRPKTSVRIELRFEDRQESLATIEADVPTSSGELHLTIPLHRQRNGQAEDELTWSPEHPRLVDATVSLLENSGTAVDTVASYVGLRTLATQRGAFWLNDRPYDVRSVLNQGYWPQSHLAAPSADAYKQDVELIKQLGFNSCRIHQKIEDPRFLFWADRLGILVWAEAPNAYEFSSTAVRRLASEWVAAVDRDASHPCIVTWVPHNESWGIQHVRNDHAQQAYARALSDLTRSLDPTRPVVCNDGWEQQNTDIITVHDYEGDAATLARTYADAAARARLMHSVAPSGHAQLVADAEDRGQPVMLTEFGGVNFQPNAERADGWGYSSATDEADWLERITGLYGAIRASDFLAGSCYTQLTDTMQETNGLLNGDRTPKAPIADIRKAIQGGS